MRSRQARPVPSSSTAYLVRRRRPRAEILHGTWTAGVGRRPLERFAVLPFIGDGRGSQG
jgi:hypothetical protein